MQKDPDCGDLVNLPADSNSRPYKDIQHIRLAEKEVMDGLVAREGGNQFVVLVNAPDDAAKRLETVKTLLGEIQFRKMRERYHDYPTSNIRAMVADSISLMGCSWDECQWGSTSLHGKTVFKRSTMPDECLYPPARHPEHGGSLLQWEYRPH